MSLFQANRKCLNGEIGAIFCERIDTFIISIIYHNTNRGCTLWEHDIIAHIMWNVRNMGMALGAIGGAMGAFF
jgi:hypothetical protein